MEQIGLTVILLAIFAAAIALVVVEPPRSSSRELGSLIARRLACVPRHPGDPCGRNPLVVAYGGAVAKTVRALALEPTPTLSGGGVGLVPVDFRRCRSRSCAIPGTREDLTASGRRVTLFTEVRDRRRSGQGLEILYWSYLPTLGWRAAIRTASADDLAAASGLRLRAREHPLLVPLETLDGRDHFRFLQGEEPPWRWRVPSRP